MIEMEKRVVGWGGEKKACKKKSREIKNRPWGQANVNDMLNMHRKSKEKKVGRNIEEPPKRPKKKRGQDWRKRKKTKRDKNDWTEIAERRCLSTQTKKKNKEVFQCDGCGKKAAYRSTAMYPRI